MFLQFLFFYFAASEIYFPTNACPKDHETTCPTSDISTFPKLYCDIQCETTDVKVIAGTIPKYAFYKSTFQTITVGNAVTIIDEGSFAESTLKIEFDDNPTLNTINKGAFQKCTFNNINFDFSEFTKLATIGDSAFDQSNMVTSSKLPALITTIGANAFTCPNKNTYDISNLNQLTEIGSYAFQEQTIQTDVNFNFLKKIEKIGYAAFKSATFQLISNDSPSFSYEDINLSPANLIEINNNAFNGASFNFFSSTSYSLTITLPKTVKNIGEKAFYNVVPKDRTTIKLNGELKNLQYIGNDAFTVTVSNKNDFILEIPSEITFGPSLYYIGDNAFCRINKNHRITKVTFDSTTDLTRIGESAFALQDQLEIVGITTLIVEDIADKAFYGCNKINVAISIKPSGTIGEKAFCDCNSLNKQLTIAKPKTPTGNNPIEYTTIGSNAFENTGLTSLKLEGKIGSIGGSAFKNCLKLTGTGNLEVDESIGANAFENDYQLKFTSIKAKTIATYAFYKCKQLGATLEFTGTVDDDDATIGSYAFYNSKINEKITIPIYVTLIDEYAFSHCQITGLEFDNDLLRPKTISNNAFSHSTLSKDLVIEQSVISIGKEAFANCNQLRELTIKAFPKEYSEDKLEIDEKAFYYCTQLATLKFGQDDFTFSSDTFRGCPLSSIDLGVITDIPEEAFYGVTTLTTINIPDSITSIGTRAFAECSGLSTVTIQESSNLKDDKIGKYAFYRCTQLSKIYIPKLVTTIDDYSFYECTALEYVDFPCSIKEINQYAFYGCTNLKGKSENEQFEIPYTITTIGKSAFQNCILLEGKLTFPSTITLIDEKAFMNCVRLSGDLTFLKPFSDSTATPPVTAQMTIGKEAFRDCSGLNGKLIFPGIAEGLSIGEGSFSGCSSLNGDLRIPDDITFSSAKYAFKGCSGFNGVLIFPDKIKTIEEGMFYGCSGLNGQIPTEGKTTINKYSFYDCSHLSGPLDLSKFKSDIPEYAFYNCAGLNGPITFDSGTTKVEKYAFYGCSGLTGNLDLTSFTEIERYAFKGCSGLTGSLRFEKAEEIQEYAFADCTGFSDSLIFDIQTKLYIWDCAFKGCTGFKKGTLTFFVDEQDPEVLKDKDRIANYYRYGYTLRIGNNAFEDTKFDNIYYNGRFVPDCDYDIGISTIKGIKTSSNYANKTFCNYPLHSSKLSGGAIAGIVIAVIVVVAVIVFLIVFFILKNKKKRDNSEAEVEMNQDP